MAQPTTYDRQFNFQNQQSLTPTDPLPAEELDAEFNAIKLTLDEVLNNLALIQRADGALANESVGRDTLDSSLVLGFGAPAKWQPNTRYVAGFDTVFYLLKFYSCNTMHVSDASQDGFPNDIAYWDELADFSGGEVQGLGTMASQDADDVDISGGAITGTTVTVGTPTQTGHAAPKTYVDSAISTLSGSVAVDIAAVSSDLSDLSDALSGQLSAPAGTRMIFQQTAAPTGWTKDTTHNDKALRLVSGAVSSGGTLSFSTVFGKSSTEGTAISVAQMPAHSHGGATASGGADHTHNYDKGAIWGSGLGPLQSGTGSALITSATATSGASAYLHTHAINSEGGGQTHAHNMDIRVLYVDAIIAEKD